MSSPAWNRRRARQRYKMLDRIVWGDCPPPRNWTRYRWVGANRIEWTRRNGVRGAWHPGMLTCGHDHGPRADELRASIP